MSAATPALSFAPYDRLPAAQRALMVGAILTAHAAAIWGLLQIREVRDAVAEAAPMFVALIAPEKPPVIQPPPPPPPPVTPPPRERPPPRLIAATPTPAPAPPPVMTAPLEIVEPPPPPAPPPPVVVAAPPVPAPPPAPKTIPASAVQYLQPLALEYPRVSRRLGEKGRVVVRVFIDESGAAHNAQVQRSSSHARLDEAAVAAVAKARFKPYTENGQPTSGWAFIPIDFELEQ